ncbi:hypothetical protein O1611_g305 [Lasiodiplodia mahajangana]|uniref:Uncharacterized protein n=1 Tax=Lasiodiplodia mahajangana TaxID=1108764 RepID=A0ACC2K0K2_9PEZI|nr:hypothetical protein O1611_g305 [Lasiodiplodia mahajangana]
MAKRHKDRKSKASKSKDSKGKGIERNPEVQKRPEYVPKDGPAEKRVSEEITPGINKLADGDVTDIGPKDCEPGSSEPQDTKPDGKRCDAIDTGIDKSGGGEAQSSRAGKAPREVVAIIGFFSFLGYEIARRAIGSGYMVYAIIGRYNQQQTLLLFEAVTADFLDCFETRIIAKPDKKEFARAFKGVDYIIYTASPPLANSKHPTDYSAEFNVHCMWDIIQAAKKHSRIKRIIVTSSITAYFKSDELDDPTTTKLIRGENAPVHVDGRIDPAHGPPHTSADYSGSRAADLLVAEMCGLTMSDIRFDFVHFLATNVFGANPLCTTAKSFNTGSNSRLLDHILGKAEDQGRLITTSVHIDDVARCHVEALSKKKVPSGRYILTSGYTNWLDAIPIAKKHFPTLTTTILPKEEEDILKWMKPCKINNARTKQIFGKGFKDFNIQIKDTLSFYFYLALEEQALERRKQAKEIEDLVDRFFRFSRS